MKSQNKFRLLIVLVFIFTQVSCTHTKEDSKIKNPTTDLQFTPIMLNSISKKRWLLRNDLNKNKITVEQISYCEENSTENIRLCSIFTDHFRIVQNDKTEYEIRTWNRKNSNDIKVQFKFIHSMDSQGQLAQKWNEILKVTDKNQWIEQDTLIPLKNTLIYLAIKGFKELYFCRHVEPHWNNLKNQGPLRDGNAFLTIQSFFSFDKIFQWIHTGLEIDLANFEVKTLATYLGTNNIFSMIDFKNQPYFVNLGPESVLDGKGSNVFRFFTVFKKECEDSYVAAYSTSSHWGGLDDILKPDNTFYQYDDEYDKDQSKLVQEFLEADGYRGILSEINGASSLGILLNEINESENILIKNKNNSDLFYQEYVINFLKKYGILTIADLK